MSDKIIQFDDAMFGSAVIERCRRRESSVEEALMEMCLAGVGTRGVDDTGRLLWGERMPSRTLSDKLKKIHKEIDEWRKRPLESEYPYVFVDGVRHKRSRGVFCQIFVGRFGVSFSPFERLFLGRFGFGQSCGLSVIA